MELWRSFFQDSRNRPVDKFGKDYSAPKCSTCNGKGRIDGKFIINPSSSDLENLIHKVRTKVLDKTGIKLELEIQIIGEKI